MNPEKSVQQTVDEWNARARAAGIYEPRDPWHLPNFYEGSLLDVPVTPEAQKRIELMKQIIADLKREKHEQETAPLLDVSSGVASEAQSLPPAIKEQFSLQPTHNE